MKHALGWLFALSALSGCGKPAESPASKAALTVKPVDWNPRRAPVAGPVAVVERDDDVVVFQKGGALVLSSGSQVALDTSVPSWTGGAVIPAPFGNGTWLVGVSADGRALRLRDESHFEAVSDRFGLEKAVVRSVCALAGKSAGFLLDGEIAIADGTKVTRYGATANEMACGGQVVALAEADGVRVIAANDPPKHFAIGLAHVAVRPDGHVIAGTETGLFVDDAQGNLRLARETAASISALAATKDGAWFVEGTELGHVGDRGVELTRGLSLPAGSSLASSASGDVWVVSGNAVARYTVEHGATPADEWAAAVDPIFEKSCRSCHGVNASSGIDLASFGAWDQKRATIVERVVTQKSMPPPGVPFPRRRPRSHPSLGRSPLNRPRSWVSRTPKARGSRDLPC